MLTHYVLAFLATAVTHLVLGIFVYINGRTRLTNITYALYSVSIAWWSGLEVLAVTALNAETAIFWWRLNHVGVIFIPIFFVHFVISLLEPDRRIQRKVFVNVIYLFGIISLVLDVLPILIREVVPKFSFRYFINPGPVYSLFFTLWVGLAIYGLIELFKIYARSSGARRNQLTYFCWSMFVAYLGGIPNFLPTFNIEIPYVMPFGTYAIPLYALATAYAIVRYRLMDIHTAIRRTTVFMVVYVLLLGFPLLGALTWQVELERWFGYRWWVVLWVVGAPVATAAHYVNMHFQRKAEQRLMRKHRQYHSTLLQASKEMTQIRDLKRLLGLTLRLITRTVGLSHASVFLSEVRENEQQFVLSAYRYRRFVDMSMQVPNDNPLIQVLEKIREPIVLEEFRAKAGEKISRNGHEDIQQQAIAQMETLNASVVVPSFIQDRLMGFFVLGERRDNRLFTTEDLNIFTTLANQAAVAIENARFYEGERQRQAALFHAASLASLGTMASSMGHQVNNRFNVVSVVASGQKAKLKALLGREDMDLLALQKATQECASQFDSLIEEALKGGQVVAAIRRIARPSTEGRKPLELKAAIQAGIDVAQYKIHMGEIDLTLDLPSDLPQILGDLSQLGEVFLNLVDNAYDAIKAKDTLLKPTGYRGRLKIAAGQTGNEVLVTVADNGLGIHDKDRDRLFVPFFTTKATSEKGTGLGLYVIKQIVEAHEGTIQIDSVYGDGTTFTIRLPIAPMEAAVGVNQIP